MRDPNDMNEKATLLTLEHIILKKKKTSQQIQGYEIVFMIVQLQFIAIIQVLASFTFFLKNLFKD